MVICLERGADLYVAQLMPLPLSVSCFSKIPIGFTLLQWRRQGGWVDGQKLYNMCVLSLSWNFVVYDKYIARPSSKEPR